MFAKIRHLAIVSRNPPLLGKFYEGLMGMKPSRPIEPDAPVAVVSDGYVGLNVNRRRPGRQAGLDHFGFAVEDVELACARIEELYPAIEVLKRPSNRPFAGLTTHDPAGNTFDLSWEQMDHRKGIYAQDIRDQDRWVTHFVLRAIDPQTLARFYREVFELVDLEKAEDDPNLYLTDGRVTLVLSPWKITDYAETGIERPAMDHIGFKVESVEAVMSDIAALTGREPALAPRTIGGDSEGDARVRLFSRCKYGQIQLSDPDGVLFDVAEV